MQYLIGVCAFLCAGLQPQHSYAANEYKDLVIHSDTYPNSCEAAQKKLLKEELTKGKVLDPEQASRAIDLILCESDNAANRAQVLSLLRQKIRERTESTGEKPIVQSVIRNVTVASSLMAAGSAWNSSISARQTRITLQYFTNEACLKSFALAYDKQKWSVYEIGQVCD